MEFTLNPHSKRFLIISKTVVRSVGSVAANFITSVSISHIFGNFKNGLSDLSGLSQAFSPEFTILDPIILSEKNKY